MTDDDNANARRNESFSTTDEGSDSEGTGSSGRSVETSDDDHQRSYCSHESEGSYSGSETSSDDYEDDDNDGHSSIDDGSSNSDGNVVNEEERTHRRRGFGRVLPIVSRVVSKSYDDDESNTNDNNNVGLIRRRGGKTTSDQQYNVSNTHFRRQRFKYKRSDGSSSSDDDGDDDDDDDGDKDRHGRRRRRRRHQDNGKQCSKRENRFSKNNNNNNNSRFSKCIHSRSTQILILALFIWLFAQYQLYYYQWKEYATTTATTIDEYLSWKNDYGQHNLRQGRRSGGGGDGNDKRPTVKTGTVVHHTIEEMDTLRRQQRLMEARAALGSAAGDDDNYPTTTANTNGEEYSTSAIRDDGGKRKRSKKRNNNKSRDSRGNSGVEKLSRGCLELEWHSYHYPNCNEIHEINLGSVVRHHDVYRRRQQQQQQKQQRQSSSEKVDTFDLPWGFVGNGLWRDVFSCDPHGEVVSYNDNNNDDITNHIPRPPAVLKVMKSEHQFDNRNFERHRRDALVMERLSSSHHLVSIYGYCANSVLTQAISHTLDDVIYARENEEVAKWSSRSGYVVRPPLESWMTKDENTGEPLATRETEIGRIQLALGVFRGLQNLHNGVSGRSSTTTSNTTTTEWLPIVHADIQAKQYLVDSTTGRIYLNDFNRCRFMTKRDTSMRSSSTTIINDTTTGSANYSGTSIESCPLYIPTAPGSARAPEEYDMAPLSEKLDIYSAGNILYGIITGKRTWDNDRGKHLKAAIQRGERPLVNDTIRYATGTVDAELTRLLDRVYEHDPLKRASAKEIVNELEQLLEREHERQ